MGILSSQKKRDLFSFSLTIFLYILLFLVWIKYFSSLTASNVPERNNEISLDLKDFVKEEKVPEIPEVQPEEKEEIAKEVEQETEQEEPVVEPTVEEEIQEKIEKIPEPVVQKPVIVPEKLPEKKPVQKPPKISKKTKKPKPKKKHTKYYKKSSKKISSVTRILKRAGSRGGSSRFLAKLKSRINSNKIYPAFARKKGMQGRVKVRFTISSSGKLKNLTVAGPRIFQKSAKTAVRRSFPISTSGARLPMNVTLVLNYRLKH